MKKSYYFEIIIFLTLTSAALGRIIYPDMREKEIEVNPFINRYSSYVIIAFELCAFYFLFFSNKFLKNIYLFTYIALIIPLSIYYLSKINVQDEIKSLYIYTPDIKSILIHIYIIITMAYIVFYK